MVDGGRDPLPPLFSLHLLLLTFLRADARLEIKVFISRLLF